MREKGPFWQWLSRVLNEKIRSPFTEFFIGFIATIFLVPVLALVPYDMAFGSRVISALLVIPSFLVMMHGIYREDDC